MCCLTASEANKPAASSQQSVAADGSGGSAGGRSSVPPPPTTTFKDDAEALRVANETHLGLVAYAITRELKRTPKVGDGLEFGMVAINRGDVSNPATAFL